MTNISIKDLMGKVRKKYRLAIYDEKELKNLFLLQISILKISIYALLFVVLVISINYILLYKTSLRKTNYEDWQTNQNNFNNSLIIDSLIDEIKLQDKFIYNIRNIIEGKAPLSKEEFLDVDTTLNNNIDTLIEYNYTQSPSDSEFIKQVEETEISKLQISSYQGTNNIVGEIFFFSPIKGIVSNQFKEEDRHYAIDIVAAPNSQIYSILDGTVILSTWTIEEGYIIQIQHANNLISVYKHNSTLLKRVGDKVKAGEIIAIIGNTGELSTGPHLHLEIWHNGVPLNPEEYINFD